MSSIKITSLSALALIATSISAFAQNTFVDSVLKNNKLRADVEAGFYYYGPFRSNIVLTPSIMSQRRPLQTNLQAQWQLRQNSNNENLLTDNPLIHGAGYITLHLCDYVSKNFDILASMTGELRGTSYGVYNTGNTIVYPQFRLGYHDTFSVIKRKLAVTVSGGNYNNIRIDEGLTYYNVDAQALYLQASYGGFTFEHMHIADLLESIGLNIDDALIQSLYYTTRKGRKGEMWKIGIGYDLNDQIYGPVYKLYRNFYTAYAALMPDSGSRVYIQVANLQGGAIDKANNNSFVIGAKKVLSNKNFRIFYSSEIRYYGSYFKNNFWNENVYYRSLTPNIYPLNYGNTIGPNLYPLRNYERPFSQFAAFTEQQLNQYSVGGATLYIDGDFRIYKQLFFKVNLDVNYMTWFSPDARLSDIPNSASFTYPFYKTGLLFQPAKNTNVFVGITNKGMNLDNTYQTFYLLRDPYFYFELTKTVQGFLER